MANAASLNDVRIAKEALLGRLLPDLIHQLRNPLNSILTSAELLEEQGENAQLRSTLLPVVSRSAIRIRDLLKSLDTSVESNHERVFVLGDALTQARELMQCRRHTVEVHSPEVAASLVIRGEYEPLWILLLSVLEESLCAANDAVWIEVADREDSIQISLTHDGPSTEKNSGFVREFILALAPALEGAVYYDEVARATVLSLPSVAATP